MRVDAAFSRLQHWLRLFRLSHMTSATVLRSFAYEIKCSSFFGSITFDTAFPHSHTTSAKVFRSFAYDIEYRVFFVCGYNVSYGFSVFAYDIGYGLSVCRSFAYEIRYRLLFWVATLATVFRRSHIASATVFRSFTYNNDYFFSRLQHLIRFYRVRI